MTIASSKEEFLKLEYSRPDETVRFNGFVIIPTEEMHDSGYMCMKFALQYNGNIVGCVGGCSDVINLNGIGGYGLNFDEAIKTRKVPVVNWSIDCLANGLIRVFCDKNLVLKGYILSTFEIFTEED